MIAFQTQIINACANAHLQPRRQDMQATMGIHYGGVQWEGGAVDGGSII